MCVRVERYIYHTYKLYIDGKTVRQDTVYDMDS